MLVTKHTMTDLYFQGLSHALQQANVSTPTLVIDKERLDHNIEQLLNTLSLGFNYRIVAKSLPSIPLLQYIMRRTGTNRLMSFHLPFLMRLVEQIPGSDILLGKPIPIAGARQFYQWYREYPEHLCFSPDVQLQWLIDSSERLKQYNELAQELKQTVRVSLEIDVGLHRGGFKPDSEFVQALEFISSSKYLTLGGLMGYEAHISRIPPLLGGAQLAYQATSARYTRFVKLVKQVLGEAKAAALCLNTGGSSTYAMYESEPIIANEIATASALVKPTDFDVFSLEHHKPAVFIAAPVLKKVMKPEIPEAPKLSWLLRLLGKLPKRGCYIYGGNWLASPCHPAGARRSNILGHSSNQEFYEIPASNILEPDDFMFFRPTQSEAILLQFGALAIYEHGKIEHWWSVLDYPKSFNQPHLLQTRIN